MSKKVTVKHEEVKHVETLSLQAMNTTFYMEVYECKIPDWKKVIMEWIQFAEETWSRFRPHNELDQLNHLKTGKTMAISPPLCDLLQTAENYRLKTNGLFSPYLLEHMSYHGYHQTFPFADSLYPSQHRPPLYNTETSPFRFNENSGTVTRVAAGKVDLGGIAKGYTVQAAANWLQSTGNATAGIVDGGGDIAVWSNGNKVWNIGVAHPYDLDREIAQFSITNGAIATSNIIYRSWFQGNRKKHHLLNGQTGNPVETDTIQATIITKSCLDAEVMTKLCFMEKGDHLRNLLESISKNGTLILVNKAGNIFLEETI